MRRVGLTLALFISAVMLAVWLHGCKPAEPQKATLILHYNCDERAGWELVQRFAEDTEKSL